MKQEMMMPKETTKAIVADKIDNDCVFALDMGFGRRLKVFVTGQPEDFTVSFFDVDRDAWVSVPKCDWQRIVERVQEQF